MATRGFDPRYEPLVKLLTTFYDLLVDLQYIPASAIKLPPHSTDSFDLAEAAEWQFTDSDAMKLIQHLPYIVFSSGDYPLYHETYCLCYVDETSDSPFEMTRDPTRLGRLDLIPPHVINLTNAHNGGVNVLYNIRTGTITAWNHFYDEPEDDWAAQPAKELNVIDNELVRWVLAFLKLDIVPRIGFNMADISDRNEEEDVALREVFKESGWDATAADGIESDNGGDASALVARLEEARIRAKRNFDIDAFTLRQRQWQERFGHAERADGIY
jgi:hypothetical protein